MDAETGNRDAQQKGRDADREAEIAAAYLRMIGAKTPARRRAELDALPGQRPKGRTR